MLSFLLLFLHITTMVAAVVVSFGAGLVMRLAFMTGQLSALRGVAMASRPIGVLIPILYVTGGLLGLLTAISFGYDLLKPWLVIAYFLFAAALLTGFLVNRPFGIRLGGLLATTPDGPITGPIATMFSAPRTLAFTALDYVVVVALLFDMVVKPFS